MKTELVEYGHAAFATGLPHRVHVPENRDGPHPTVVMLHGRHGTEDVTWIFAKSLPANWLLVAPRAIEFEPESAAHETGYSWMNMQDGVWPHLDEFEDATTAISDFVLALPETYGADPNQIYFLGFSQGAAAAFATAVEYPGLVRGIAGLVGFMPEIPASVLMRKPLSDVPVLLLAGERDDRIPLDISHLSRERLLACGADLMYRQYNVGHKLNRKGVEELTQWWMSVNSTI